VQNALRDLAVDPGVIDDEQIGAGTVGLSAYKQMACSCVISILTGTGLVRSLKCKISQMSQINVTLGFEPGTHPFIANQQLIDKNPL
jgi:hypothetical protein